MALFDTNEFDPKFYDATTSIDKEEMRWSVKENTMWEAIGDLEEGKQTHFVTCASWSMYELLNYVLRHHGLKGSDVDIFTWNLGLSAVHSFIKLKEDGYIRRFRVLCHSTMQRFVADALAVLDQYADTIVLYPNHAKGFLINCNGKLITSISSANFNNNPQIEAGVITLDKTVYQMHYKWLNLLYERRELLANQLIAPIQERTEPKSGHVLFIVRGLAGSGKSTMARSMADEVYSNDDFFTNSEGKYTYNPAGIKNARAQCFNNVKTAMENGVKKIAVANTFSVEADIAEFQELASKYGYICHVCTVENRHNGRNIHGVEEKAIEDMRKRFRVML